MKNLKIFSGPSKSMLIRALFENTSAHPEKVIFFCEEGAFHVFFHVFVDSVEREDGSGESWNIVGHLRPTNVKVKIYYHSFRRSGVLTPEELPKEVFTRCWCGWEGPYELGLYPGQDWPRCPRCGSC